MLSVLEAVKRDGRTPQEELNQNIRAPACTHARDPSVLLSLFFFPAGGGGRGRGGLQTARSVSWTSGTSAQPPRQLDQGNCAHNIAGTNRSTCCVDVRREGARGATGLRWVSVRMCLRVLACGLQLKDAGRGGGGR